MIGQFIDKSSLVIRGKTKNTCDTVQPLVAVNVPNVWQTTAENKNVHTDEYFLEICEGVRSYSAYKNFTLKWNCTFICHV